MKGRGCMNRLKELRQDSNLKQRVIADRLGITQRKYSYIETGRSAISVETLCKLSEYYQVNMEYILGITDTKKLFPKSTFSKEL